MGNLSRDVIVEAAPHSGPSPVIVTGPRVGITRAADLPWRFCAAGSRHVIGPVFFDGPGPDGLAWSDRLAGLRAWLKNR